MDRNDEFFIHVNDIYKRLYISRPESITSDALSPCCMTPEDVDYEMASGKHPEILEITGMNQESLEYFVTNYGKNYRYLQFFKCQKIKDFSPLEDLERLEQVWVYWNIGTDRLWNFSRNTALNTLRIIDCKKITLNPDLLATSPALEYVSFNGSAFSNFIMDNLDVFGRMPKLKRLELNRIRLNDNRMDFLSSASGLERFDFDAGMLTTEEIAWIVAKYPQLSGRSLCAYNREDAMLADVRVCGFRKPGLNLPQQQKRLDKYVAEFNAMVEKYRQEQ